jgi:hypothetical protein
VRARAVVKPAMPPPRMMMLSGESFLDMVNGIYDGRVRSKGFQVAVDRSQAQIYSILCSISRCTKAQVPIGCSEADYRGADFGKGWGTDGSSRTCRGCHRSATTHETRTGPLLRCILWIATTTSPARPPSAPSCGWLAAAGRRAI